MASRIQLVSIILAVLLLFGVLELVRRRRLMERYALLWLLAAAVLIALASWSQGLAQISSAIGIAYPPTALFFVAFGFVLLLLLHFSTAVSRLSDQTKVLAQRLALLEERVQLGEEARVTPRGNISSQGQSGSPEAAEVERELKRLGRLGRL
ncbi:MAG TPA: DUF2304 domain-containing protein [Myxococcaceae bacterium]|nr:DUF2304 domain-containing protein [Myxococcaceae bacterium]